MTRDCDAEISAIARTLSEIACTLESTSEPARRVHRVLGLTRELVIYQQCALLKALPGTAHELIVQPEVSRIEHDAIRRRLFAILRLVSDDDAAPVATDASRHLTLPVMGLDEVIGIIRVTPPDGMIYQARHIRLLSVVAAQIGAYLALIKLHADQQRQTQDLAIANEVQQTLAGIVSHDLRTPLQVITTVAASLLPRATDQRQARALERALRNAQKATRLINDLLDVTQARVAGAVTANRIEADLRGLVVEIVDDERTTHPARTITLQDDLDGALIGWWDPDRLSQLVINLIENALAHGDPSSPVTIALRTDDGRAVLTVHNRGPAIPDALLPVIFDPFTRPERQRSRGGGIGLGLYIVDQIARAHGGTVGVVSSADDGTTFTVALPIEAAAEVQTAPAAAPPLVLVVDDDDEVREGIAAILERRGYTVGLAANGAEALAQLHAGLRPQLMLVDVHMPIMDGAALCDACSADPALAGIPVLVVTADTAGAVRASRFGAAGVLMKPVRPATLVDTVAVLSSRVSAEARRVAT